MSKRGIGILVSGVVYILTIPLWGHGWILDMLCIAAFAVFVSTIFNPLIGKKGEGPK